MGKKTDNADNILVALGSLEVGPAVSSSAIPNILAVHLKLTRCHLRHSIGFGGSMALASNALRRQRRVELTPAIRIKSHIRNGEI